MRGIARRFRNGESGQALVEFALVLPLVLILVLGIMDFARAWNLHQVLTDAAREGARKAVIHDDTITKDSVLAAVGKIIGSGTYDPTKATVSFPDGFHTGQGNPGTVRITMPYRFGFIAPFVKLLSANGSNTMMLTTQATMRNE
jgi:Flp pilus assembly protein TadG